MTATTGPSIIPVKPTSEPPVVILPDNGLFAVRAARFEQLAGGHALGDWLRFLAVLSSAQHEALQTLPELPLPTADALEQAREHHMPVLPAHSWPRDPAWHKVLRQLAATVAPAAPAIAQRDLARLAALPADKLEELAERVLHPERHRDDAGLLPYVGAALQVLWTGLASRLGPTLAPLDVPGVCPCCGFLPVASVVKPAGTGDNVVANLRYLHCALCNTEWNLVRVKCAACDSTAGIGYRQIEGEGAKSPEAVRAETCDSCKSYLKIVYTEKGGVDAVADDLASLPIDILVDEAGYARAGPNLLFLPGSA